MSEASMSEGFLLRHFIFGKFTRIPSQSATPLEYEVLACAPGEDRQRYKEAADEVLAQLVRALCHRRTDLSVCAFIPEPGGGGWYLKTLTAAHRDTATRPLDACFHAVLLNAAELKALAHDPRRLDGCLAQRMEPDVILGPREIDRIVTTETKPVELPIRVNPRELASARPLNKEDEQLVGVAIATLRNGKSLYVDGRAIPCASSVAASVLRELQDDAERASLAIMAWNVPPFEVPHDRDLHNPRSPWERQFAQQPVEPRLVVLADAGGRGMPTSWADLAALRASASRALASENRETPVAPCTSIEAGPRVNEAVPRTEPTSAAVGKPVQAAMPPSGTDARLAASAPQAPGGLVSAGIAPPPIRTPPPLVRPGFSPMRAITSEVTQRIRERDFAPPESETAKTAVQPGRRQGAGRGWRQAAVAAGLLLFVAAGLGAWQLVRAEEALSELNSTKLLLADAKGKTEKAERVIEAQAAEITNKAKDIDGKEAALAATRSELDQANAALKGDREAAKQDLGTKDLKIAELEGKVGALTTETKQFTEALAVTSADRDAWQSVARSAVPGVDQNGTPMVYQKRIQERQELNVSGRWSDALTGVLSHLAPHRNREDLLNMVNGFRQEHVDKPLPAPYMEGEKQRLFEAVRRLVNDARAQ